MHAGERAIRHHGSMWSRHVRSIDVGIFPTYMVCHRQSIVRWALRGHRRSFKHRQHSARGAFIRSAHAVAIIVKPFCRWFDRFSYRTKPHSCSNLADPDPAERILCWPEERIAWVEENSSHDKLFAANVLEALSKRADHASYTVRDIEGGMLMTGPVSSILLRNEAEATEFIAFIQKYLFYNHIDR